MKKFVAFSLGALLTMGFAACSRDDDTLDPSVDNNVDNGNVAYMSVTIQGATEANTRSLTANDFSIGDENTVKDIKFYYFDKDGNFMAKGSLWQGEDWVDGKNVTTVTSSTDANGVNNIEKYRVSVISVPNYNSESYVPKMMVTVVNPPENLALSIGDNISTLYEGLIDYQATLNDNNKYYVMTTSSYIGEDHSETYYYTTDLSNATFFPTVTQAEKATDDQRVKVYVERLAVKVTTTLKDGNAKFCLGYFDLDGDATTEKEKVYITFRGWKLNGTARQSYYMKHIDKNWVSDQTGLNFEWNDKTLYRSFWCMSKDYKTGNYTFPDRYAPNGVTSGYYDGFDLHFVSGNDMKSVNFGSDYPQYCNENTQSATALSEKGSYTPHLPGAVTHVLLLAQFTDENGNDIYSKDDKTIVKYGTEYLYQPVVLKEFATGVKLDQYQYNAAAADATADWKTLTYENLDIVSADELNGYVTVRMKSDLKDKSFRKVETAPTDATEGVYSDITLTDMNDLLEAFKGTTTMTRYNNGYMYYYSLIRHLNSKTDGDGTNAVAEGHYGVVRNHSYQINILGFAKKYDENGNKVDPEDDDDTKNDVYDPDGPGKEEDPIDPGKAIEDQDEPIIPNDEEDKNYYLGAEIHVLSWRLVSHNVKL
jgi:hypothetical protein